MSRTLILALVLVAPTLLRAEGPSGNPEEVIRAMQAQAESRRMSEEFKNPKNVEIGKGRAVRGSRSAPIKLFEFSDFQCPFCRNGFLTVEELRKKYGKKILFVFKQLPLPFHPLALPAAKRFEAIAMQSSDKAYKFHDEVFTNQDKLGSEGEKFLDDVAKKLKVNVAKMKKDMDSDTVKKRLEQDQTQAKDLGFTGTPGFVVAGVTIRGAYPVGVFEEIIDRRLKEGQEKKGKTKEKKVPAKEEKKETSESR